MCSVNMYSIIISTLFFSALILSVHSTEPFCSKDTDNFLCTFSTKTPYRFISANVDDSEIKIPGCEAKKIWLIIRHGTRYPQKRLLSQSEMLPIIRDTILDNCQKNKCPLNFEQQKQLAMWQLTVPIDENMKLTDEGENELIALGERYQARFPTLMPETYNNRTYKFKFTATQRTEESAKHFAIGLFGKYQSKRVWYPLPEKKDRILRFYKSCDKWQIDVKKNLSTRAEEEKFKNSSIMIEVLEDMSNRFNYKFDFATIQLIYRTCAFETAWSEENISPWCDFFTFEEFKILEYVQDLHYYWIDGYQNRLTCDQACIALADMFNFMKSDSSIKTSAYFTHSGTILKILCYLGISKDQQPLLHDNYDQMKNRLWRMSIIDTFASNIAFILYDCEKVGASILAMHQEHIIQLPGCPKDTPCPMSTMMASYPTDNNSCNFDAMCSITA